MTSLDLPALESLHDAATRHHMTTEQQDEALRVFRLSVAVCFPELMRLARIGQIVEDTYKKVAKEGGGDHG